jgi:hypothetical protein
MPTFHFEATTSSTPEQFVTGLTDFGPGRKELFENSADGYPFPDAAGALRNVGVGGALVMHLQDGGSTRLVSESSNRSRASLCRLLGTVKEIRDWLSLLKRPSLRPAAPLDDSRCVARRDISGPRFEPAKWATVGQHSTREQPKMPEVVEGVNPCSDAERGEEPQATATPGAAS